MQATESTSPLQQTTSATISVSLLLNKMSGGSRRFHIEHHMEPGKPNAPSRVSISCCQLCSWHASSPCAHCERCPLGWGSGQRGGRDSRKGFGRYAVPCNPLEPLATPCNSLKPICKSTGELMENLSSSITRGQVQEKFCKRFTARCGRRAGIPLFDLF